MICTWSKHLSELNAALDGLACELKGRQVAAEEAFTWWRDATACLRDARGTIYLVGNGASASMASHMAADLAKNGRLHTQVFSDLSLITAISNDMGYENVFAEPLRRRARQGDMLVAISSSGESPNVLAAVEVARESDMLVVGLSAMGADNRLRRESDLSLYVPAETYGFAESAHAAILHHWMDMVEVDDA